jgi:folate-dependent phosphoribosylglycinamide formyltransferase PurN
MRVAVITGELPHHKHLCVELARNHDLAGIVHFDGRSNGAGPRIRKLRREVARNGLSYAVMRALGRMPGSLVGWDEAAEYERAEREFFPDAEASYAALDSVTVHDSANVNDPASIALLRSLEAEVVICLGGPIYRRPLIDACGLMLNFHSGISPLYNGTSTISFAFANGHPHLCGGTLMTMSHVVDGGEVLAHQLPAIEKDDTPATLFMKTTRGAADAYVRFLDHLERAGTYTKSEQTPPLFECLAADWTVYHRQRIRQHLRAGIAERFVRDEEQIAYWALESDDEARRRCAATIERLLRIH